MLRKGINPSTGEKITKAECANAKIMIYSVAPIAASVTTAKVSQSWETTPNKKVSGADVPKFFTLTEAGQVKLANQYKKKSPEVKFPKRY